MAVLIANPNLWSGIALPSHGHRRAGRNYTTVMADLVSAIHDFSPRPKNSVSLPLQVVDGRDKPGHDGDGLARTKTARKKSLFRRVNPVRELRRKSA